MARPKMKDTAAQELADYILDHPGGTLTIETIDKICGTASSKLQYILLIGPLVKDGILVPVTDGGNPARGNEMEPIYQAYTIASSIPTSLSHSLRVMDGTATVDKKYRSEQMMRAAAERRGGQETREGEPQGTTPEKEPQEEELAEVVEASAEEGDELVAVAQDAGVPESAEAKDASPQDAEAIEDVVSVEDAPKEKTEQIERESEVRPQEEMRPSTGQRPQPAKQPAEPKPPVPPAPIQPKKQPQQKPKQKQQSKVLVPKEISGLSRELTKDGYLASHPQVAAGWKRELFALDKWLKDNPELPEAAILEERSFEVFGNEKALGPKGEKRGGITLPALIATLGLSKRLNIMDDPFNELIYFVPKTRRRTIVVLVVENHAPFVHVQAALAEGRRTIFGRHVDGVIYGEGYKVVFDDALKVTESYFSEGRTVRYLYWGDIDRPGIDVMERAAEGREMEPLVEAYEAMIEAVSGKVLPASGARAMPQHMGISLASQLKPECLEVYMRVLAEGLRIPQEALLAAHIRGTEETSRLPGPLSKIVPRLQVRRRRDGQL